VAQRSIGFSREAFKAGRTGNDADLCCVVEELPSELKKLESKDGDGGAGRASPRGIDRKRGAKFLHGYLVSVLLQSVVSLTEVGLRGAEPSWLVGRRRRGLTQEVLREEQDKERRGDYQNRGLSQTCRVHGFPRVFWEDERDYSARC
jgi:hypothetical protein